MAYPAKQFRTFFHDDHVCSKVGIDDDISTYGAQGCHDFAFHIAAGRKTKFVAHEDTHRRSKAEDRGHVGVGEIV